LAGVAGHRHQSPSRTPACCNTQKMVGLASIVGHKAGAATCCSQIDGATVSKKVQVSNGHSSVLNEATAVFFASFYYVGPLSVRAAPALDQMANGIEVGRN